MATFFDKFDDILGIFKSHKKTKAVPSESTSLEVKLTPTDSISDSLSYDPPPSQSQAHPTWVVSGPFLTAVADNEAPRDYIQTRFESFHTDNPQVYNKLVELAFLAKANGHNRLGIKTLFERLRWYYTVETKGNERFKLDNNFTSRYARLIMANVPALDGFFATRELY